MRRFLPALFLLAAASPAANAMVLSCFPAGPKGQSKIEAYVDGFAEGDYPPQKIGAIRVLARMGEDVFEFFPEQTRELSLRDGVLRIHMRQPLSAGESAEIRFEGKIGARKAEPFAMQLRIRAERSSGEAQVRCTID
jgi:hypothetical protein